MKFLALRFCLLPSEYLMYLKRLPDIKQRLQNSLLITLYSANAIPSKKRPRCALNKINMSIRLFYTSRRPAPLDIWYVVSIGDKPQWLPMGRNKSNDVITDVMNFVKPLQYPIIVSTNRFCIDS